MAGTRGIAKLRGEQLKSAIMRDRHFDDANKISESKIDLKWADHREILENTKIDVYVQSNSQAIAGLSSLDVTSIIGDKAVSTGVTVEGVVTSAKVEMRENGSEDFPYVDATGDRVYGKLRYDDVTDPLAPKYFLDFFSEEAGVETAYTFAVDAKPADFRYVLRTNLSVIPVDSLVKGGSGFVEGATDANAYMNLNQLKADLYGGSGTLDNDGNGNLSTSIVQQIADEATARSEADTAILTDLASSLAGEGAALVGVVADANHAGLTVQAAITDLAARLAAAENLVTDIQNKDDRFIFEAAGGETQVLLPVGKKARPNTLFVSLSGSLLAPGINFEEIADVDGNITGVNFAPDVLSGGDGTPENPPDVVFMWFEKVL